MTSPTPPPQRPEDSALDRVLQVYIEYQITPDGQIGNAARKTIDAAREELRRLHFLKDAALSGAMGGQIELHAFRRRLDAAEARANEAEELLMDYMDPMDAPPEDAARWEKIKAARAALRKESR
jgi:hypothetical protein